MAIVQCNNKMMKTPWKKKMLSFKLQPCGAEQTFGVSVTERTTSNGDLAWEGSLSITRLRNFRRNFKKNQLLLFQNSPLLPFKAPRKKETHDRTNETFFFLNIRILKWTERRPPRKKERKTDEMPPPLSSDFLRNSNQFLQSLPIKAAAVLTYITWNAMMSVGRFIFVCGAQKSENNFIIPQPAVEPLPPFRARLISLLLTGSTCCGSVCHR